MFAVTLGLSGSLWLLGLLWLTHWRARRRERRRRELDAFSTHGGGGSNCHDPASLLRDESELDSDMDNLDFIRPHHHHSIDPAHPLSTLRRNRASRSTQGTQGDTRDTTVVVAASAAASPRVSTQPTQPSCASPQQPSTANSASAFPDPDPPAGPDDATPREATPRNYSLGLPPSSSRSPSSSPNSAGSTSASLPSRRLHHK